MELPRYVHAGCHRLPLPVATVVVPMLNDRIPPSDLSWPGLSELQGKMRPIIRILLKDSTRDGFITGGLARWKSQS